MSGADLAFQGAGIEFVNGARVDVGNLHIPAGRFTVLLGRSGCGKSTLLSMAAGLVRPTRGRLLHDGNPLLAEVPQAALIFQENNLFPWMSARENISFALRNLGLSRIVADEMALTLLAQVGLEKIADQRPAALSGGMRQRIALARSLALKPRLLFLDEPFSALDVQTRRLMQDQLLRTWQATGATVLMVTHDLQEALQLADRIVLMASVPFGHIERVLEVDLPRPRRSGDGRLKLLHQQLDDFLTQETLLAEHLQAP